MGCGRICSCVFLSPNPGGVPLPHEAYSALGASPPFSPLSQTTDIPRRAQEKAHFRLSLNLEIPSISHLVPKSPLHADTYYVSENQEMHPCEATLAFPHLSTLAKQFDLSARRKEDEFNSAPGARARHKDEEFQAPRIERVGEEKEPVTCLYQESPQSHIRDQEVDRSTHHHPLRTKPAPDS